MKLYLIRHAQSERNIGKNSPVDAELTEVGKEQARRLGIYFKDAKIDKVYVSTMKRAKTTYEVIKDYLKVPVVYRKDIVEHNMGIHGDRNDDWGKYSKFAKRQGKNFLEYKPKNGESLEETFERARKFYKLIMKEKGNIVVIAHGIFLKYLILNILGMDIKEGSFFSLSNASVSQFNFERGKLKEFHINDYHHLIIGNAKDIDIIGKIYGRVKKSE